MIDLARASVAGPCKREKVVLIVFFFSKKVEPYLFCQNCEGRVTTHRICESGVLLGACGAKARVEEDGFVL